MNAATSQELTRVAYTVDELAQLLPMSPAAIRKQIHRGTIPVFRIGARVFVRRTELEKILSGDAA